MGCAASKAKPSVEEGAAQAIHDATKAHQPGIFATNQQQQTAMLQSAMAMQNDPRIQELQAKMMAQAMNNPAMAQQMQQMQQMMGGGMPAGAIPVPVVQAQAVAEGGVPEQNPAAKILELKTLLEAGAITQDEFDTKKSELLDQI